MLTLFWNNVLGSCKHHMGNGGVGNADVRNGHVNRHRNQRVRIRRNGRSTESHPLTDVTGDVGMSKS